MYDCIIRGHVSRMFCVAAHCAVVVVVIVVCAVLGCCGELGLGLGKCLCGLLPTVVGSCFGVISEGAMWVSCIVCSTIHVRF